MPNPRFFILALCLAAANYGLAAEPRTSALNSLVQDARVHDAPLPAARLVAAAMLTFDALDSVEKLLLQLEADTKQQLAAMEQQAATHPRDERSVRVRLATIRRRTLAGMPITMRELGRQYHARDGSGGSRRIDGPYAKAMDLWKAFDTVQEEPNFRSQAYNQYKEWPLTDPFGLPYGPFSFGQPLHISPETKAAFKAAASAIQWDNVDLPEAARKIGRGLADETFWGAYK